MRQNVDDKVRGEQSFGVAASCDQWMVELDWYSLGVRRPKSEFHRRLRVTDFEIQFCSFEVSQNKVRGNSDSIEDKTRLLWASNKMKIHKKRTKFEQFRLIPGSLGYEAKLYHCSFLSRSDSYTDDLCAEMSSCLALTPQLSAHEIVLLGMIPFQPSKYPLRK